MSQYQPLAPMSAGNVVSTAVSLYHSHFKSYLRIALRATLWQILASITFLISVASLVLLAAFWIILNNPFFGNLINIPLPPSIVSLIAFVLFSGGLIISLIALSRMLVNFALISRFAFTKLIHQPETIPLARQELLRYKWSFLRICLQFFAYAGAILVISWLTFAIFSYFSLFLMKAIAFATGIMILFWLATHWFIAEVPLAVESNMTGGKSIQRSWHLIRNTVFFMQLIIFIAYLVTLPFVINGSFLLQIYLGFLPQNSIFYDFIFVTSILLGLAVNCFISAFWQIIKAVIYYNLRSRREGLNFTLESFENINPLKQIRLATPESIEFNLTLAGIGNRTYALLIDLLIINFTLIFILVLWVFLFIFFRLAERFQGILWIYAMQFLLVFAIFVGYFAFFETQWQGQTPGKKWVNIRVIQENGRPMCWQQAIPRALLLPIDQLFFVGALLILFEQKEKRLGDLVAKTIVIQEDQKQKPDEIKISSEAEVLSQEIGTISEVYLLSSENFAVLSEYLQHRDEMLLSARHDVARKLAYEVKDIIHLSDIPNNVTASLFLEAIYVAYRQLN